MPPAKPGKRFPARTYIFLAFVVCVLGGLLWDGSPLGGFILQRAVALKFRSVRGVSPAELVAWMADPQRPPPLLVDARSSGEYDVSHLEGAVRIDPLAPDLAVLTNVPKDNPIVVYDGPGVISAAMAQALSEAGWQRVSHMEGGLFRWADEGRRMVNDSGDAKAVRAANWKWARLLKAEHRE